MQGARIADGALPFWEWPACAYGRVMRDGAWVWRATTPNGMHADLQVHEVVEHEDGTITVSPSILTWREVGEQRVREEWHGYLERGAWRSC